MPTVLFGFFGTLILLGAVWVVALPNLFRAALSLGLVLVGVAAVFLLLEAEFLAFVQILVYVGAILTLVVFAIMLTARLQIATTSPASRPKVPAALVSIGVFAMLSSVTRAIAGSSGPLPGAVSLATLGQQLVTTLVLPFELISLVFVVAIVGAVAIAAPRAPSSSSK